MTITNEKTSNFVILKIQINLMWTSSYTVLKVKLYMHVSVEVYLETTLNPVLGYEHINMRMQCANYHSFVVTLRI